MSMKLQKFKKNAMLLDLLDGGKTGRMWALWGHMSSLLILQARRKVKEFGGASKGQLISEYFFLVLIVPKNERNICKNLP